MHTTLIDVPTLRAALASNDPPLVLDCRHRLSDPAAGDTLYAQGHIPGARRAHLDRDLAAAVPAAADRHPGRHPLPGPAAWCRTLAGWGHRPDRQVVAYDDAGGAIAARAWWMVRASGHRAVAVLDGGFGAWIDDGGALERGEPAPPVPGSMPTLEAWPDVASWDDVARLAAGDRTAVLLDARARERFRGAAEPVDPVAGHIPGAVSAPFADNLAADGRFRSPSELRGRYAGLLGQRSGEQVIASCGSGVTACHDLLALAIAGLDGGRLFVPSWSGWCRSPGTPRASGD